MNLFAFDDDWSIRPMIANDFFGSIHKIYQQASYNKTHKKMQNQITHIDSVCAFMSIKIDRDDILIDDDQCWPWIVTACARPDLTISQLSIERITIDENLKIQFFATAPPEKKIFKKVSIRTAYGARKSTVDMGRNS